MRVSVGRILTICLNGNYQNRRLLFLSNIFAGKKMIEADRDLCGITSVSIPSELKKHAKLDDILLRIDEVGNEFAFNFIDSNFSNEDVNFILGRIMQMSKIRPNNRLKLAKLYIAVSSLFEEELDFKQILSICQPLAYFIMNELTNSENKSKIAPKFCMNIQSNLLYKLTHTYRKGSIKAIIKDDNILELKKFLSANPDYDIHKRKEISLMDNLGDRRRLSLVGIAAHYGSVKCIKHLISLGLKPVSDEADEAVIGGNLAILKMFKITNCLDTAIRWYRNDIADIILREERRSIFSFDSAKDNLQASLFLIGGNSCHNKMTHGMHRALEVITSLSSVNLLLNLLVCK